MWAHSPTCAWLLCVPVHWVHRIASSLSHTGGLVRSRGESTRCGCWRALRAALRQPCGFSTSVRREAWCLSPWVPSVQRVAGAYRRPAGKSCVSLGVAWRCSYQRGQHPSGTFQVPDASKLLKSQPVPPGDRWLSPEGTWRPPLYPALSFSGVPCCLPHSSSQSARRDIQGTKHAASFWNL